MSTMITTHLSREEFTCHDGTPYPVDEPDDEMPGQTWLTSRLMPLAAAIETIREAAGNEPIIIDSGYRTLAYDERIYERSAKNGLVAPATSSQHPKGRAADIRHATLSPSALHVLIGKLIAAGKLPQIGGMGLYPNFVHIDVRPKPASGHVAQWGGERLSNIA